MAAKKRRTRAPVKRRYKVRVIVQPLSPTPTTSVPMNPIPTPMVATSGAYTLMPVVKSAATSIPVTIYNLAQGKFEGILHPAGRPQAEENPSTPSPLQQRSQPEAIHTAPVFQVREDTPWPNNIPAFTNLFETSTDWPIPPTQTPAVKVEKAEVLPRVAAILCAMVLPKQQNNTSAEEKCTWGLHYPISKKEEEEGTEDWNSDRLENQQRNHYPQNPQHPQTYDVPDKYS